ncbi:MAG: VOC family protein [Pararhizobium sp.]
MTIPPHAPRALDHCVLPTADLSVARARLSALGFTVAPEALHPFGTKNACVYFADGTFLEPLAIGPREDCEAAIRAGNVFVAHDHAFRFRNGEDGFSALVFGSDDAAADDAGFRAEGLSAGDPLAFTRPFETPSGERGEAGFRLAFAADRRAPDLLVFTCERAQAPAVDRAALEDHRNGVNGIAEVILSEPNPSDFQYFLQETIGQRDVAAGSFGIRLAARNGAVSVLTPAGMDAHLPGHPPRVGRGLRLEGIVFSVRDLARTRDLLEKAAIPVASRRRRIVVAPAAGQGACFVFEER